MTTHGEHGTGRRAHDLFGHASEHQVRDATPAVRAENDQVNCAVGGRFHNGGRWVAAAHLRRHHNPFSVAAGHQSRQTSFVIVDVPAGVGLDVHQMD
jgi:hypothetical protein